MEHLTLNVFHFICNKNFTQALCHAGWFAVIFSSLFSHSQSKPSSLTLGLHQKTKRRLTFLIHCRDFVWECNLLDGDSELLSCFRCFPLSLSFSLLLCIYQHFSSKHHNNIKCNDLSRNNTIVRCTKHYDYALWEFSPVVIVRFTCLFGLICFDFRFSARVLNDEQTYSLLWLLLFFCFASLLILHSIFLGISFELLWKNYAMHLPKWIDGCKQIVKWNTRDSPTPISIGCC